MVRTLLRVLAVLVALALPWLLFYPNLQADIQGDESVTVEVASDGGSSGEAGPP